MLQNHTSLVERKWPVFVNNQNPKQNQQQIPIQSWVCFCGFGVTLRIFTMKEFAFMRDPPPSMHVIAFSDLDHFISTHCLQFRWCNTQLHYTFSFPQSVITTYYMWDWDTMWADIIIKKGKSCTKWATMFLSFVPYVDNSGMLHVEWLNIVYSPLSYTIVVI